jgi:hypothetical protein
MLQRSEQRIELCKMGTMVGFELLDLGNAGGKNPLNRERRNWQTGLA